MDSEIFTLGGLAILVAAGWLIDLLGHRSPPALEREMANQIKKSAETLRGLL